MIVPQLLAWRPFLDPIDLHDLWWLTIIPVAYFVSMAYKAVRMQDLAPYWRAVGIMAIQIVLAMIALSAALHIVIEFLVPFLTA